MIRPQKGHDTLSASLHLKRSDRQRYAQDATIARVRSVPLEALILPLLKWVVKQRTAPPSVGSPSENCRHYPVWRENVDLPLDLLRGGPAWRPKAVGELTTPKPPTTIAALASGSLAQPPGQVAQLVEHRTENPSVGGSTPPLTTARLSEPTVLCIAGSCHGVNSLFNTPAESPRCALQERRHHVQLLLRRTSPLPFKGRGQFPQPNTMLRWETSHQLSSTSTWPNMMGVAGVGSLKKDLLRSYSCACHDSESRATMRPARIAAPCAGGKRRTNSHRQVHGRT